MRLSTLTKVAAIAAAVALSAAACGGAPAETSGPPVAEAPTFEAGTTMARLSEAGAIRVGTKFDQPGFGLLGLDGTPTGFDVEIAKIIAAGLGIAPEGITYTEAPSALREEVLDVMTTLAKEGMTMLVVTHEMGFARKAAHRVVFMSDGEIVEDAKPEEFFSNPTSDRAKDFLGKILSH